MHQILGSGNHPPRVVCCSFEKTLSITIESYSHQIHVLFNQKAFYLQKLHRR